MGLVVATDISRKFSVIFQDCRCRWLIFITYLEEHNAMYSRSVVMTQLRERTKMVTVSHHSQRLRKDGKTGRSTREIS